MKIVDLTAAQNGYEIDTPFSPNEVSVEVFPFALARAGKPVPAR